LVEKLVNVCHRVYWQKYVAAKDGNLSVRTPYNTVLITRSSVCKGEITPEDILEIDLNGRIINGKGKLSTEFKIHLAAYKRRAEINSVIHAHPVYSTAFALVGKGFTRAIFPEVVLGIGKVPLCKYGTPATDELVDSMKEHLDYAWALLLENHGVVTFGKDIEDAFFKLEKLEHAAKTLFVANQLGMVKSIPLLKLKKLYRIAEEVYGIKINEKNRMDY